MALKTNARNPLAYMGVKASTPPQLIVRRVKPTSDDYQGFREGSFWVVPDIGTSDSNKVWVLTSISGSVANWIDISAAGSLTIPGPDHSVLLSDGSGGINSTGPGTAGQALVSQGAAADPIFSVISAAGGGTGLTSIAAHNLLVGDGTNALKELAPSATLGEALLSQGSSADPAYGVVNVSGGGLGSATHTAYSTLCGGTTTTGNVQSVVGLGTPGQVLTSNGAGTLPTWQNVSSTPITFPGANGDTIITQYDTAGSGTHTFNINTSHLQMILISGGAGGAGGGNYSSGSDQSNAFSAMTILELPAAYFGGGGAVVSYTVGAGGTGGAAGVAGTAGGMTSFGQYETSTVASQTLTAKPIFKGPLYSATEVVLSAYTEAAIAKYGTSLFLAPGRGGKGGNGYDGKSFIRLFNPAGSSYSALIAPRSFVGKGYQNGIFGGFGRNASPTSYIDSNIKAYVGGGGGAGKFGFNGGNGSGPGGGGGAGFGYSNPANRTAGGNGADGGIIIIEYLM